MRELFLNTGFKKEDIKELSHNILLGTVFINDKVISLNIFDFNLMEDSHYLPFDPNIESNYSNEIMENLFYKEKVDIYYYVISNNKNILWKDSFVDDKQFCRKHIISPMELDTFFKKTRFETSGEIVNIKGDTGSGKTTKLKEKGLTNFFNPLFEQTKIGANYDYFLKRINIRKNHYSLMSTGEKMGHNLSCYLDHCIANKSDLIFDNSIEFFDDLRRLSVIDLLREITLEHQLNIYITSCSKASDFVDRKFNMFNKYTFIKL